MRWIIDIRLFASLHILLLLGLESFRRSRVECTWPIWRRACFQKTAEKEEESEGERERKTEWEWCNLTCIFSRVISVTCVALMGFWWMKREAERKFTFLFSIQSIESIFVVIVLFRLFVYLFDLHTVHLAMWSNVIHPLDALKICIGRRSIYSIAHGFTLAVGVYVFPCFLHVSGLSHSEHYGNLWLPYNPPIEWISLALFDSGTNKP